MCDLLLVYAGKGIRSVRDELDCAADRGVRNLLVQPAYLMKGYEYSRLCGLLKKEYAGKFVTIRVGAPLLDSERDFEVMAAVMAEAAARFDDGGTAVCFVGHGSKTPANAVYRKIQELLHARGYTNCFVGTLNKTADACSLEGIVKLVKDGGFTRVVLRPMMVSVGHHAEFDMAGEHEGSWKNAFISAGFQPENVICDMNGLGDIPAVRALLDSHAREAVALNEMMID